MPKEERHADPIETRVGAAGSGGHSRNVFLNWRALLKAAIAAPTIAAAGSILTAPGFAETDIAVDHPTALLLNPVDRVARIALDRI